MRLKRAWSVGAHLRSTLGILALVAAPAMAQGQQATISGRVLATGSNEPLVDSRVMVAGTSLGTTTNSEGRYTLTRVPTGTVTIRVLRVGYEEQKKSIAITEGQAATLDFTMVPAVVQLQEIVTTATGEQRRVEIGNAVTTLGDVNQKVEAGLDENLGQLMAAKSAGVTVLPGAMTGSTPVVRIRGIGSLATTGSGITNDPIYIVDGVRYVQQHVSMGFTGTQASLLNDLDPEEIEDIEIVKGPSAATLYGTDAANGVIVITTKKGRAGATRWNWYGEEGAVDDRSTYPTDYASWGHVTAAGATKSLAAGTLERCTLVTEGQGKCAVDSLTSFNVLDNPATSPIALGNRNDFGGNASGGSDAVRFFVSGDINNEVGPVKMPGFAQATLVDSMSTPMRDEWLHPEQFQQYSFRSNLTASLSPKFDLNGSAGFSNTNQRLPQVDNNIFSYIYNALNNPGFNYTSTKGIKYNEIGSLGEFKNGYGNYSPAQIMQSLSQNGTQRFTGSGDANWRPFSWMQNEGTAGVDLADNAQLRLCRFNECPNSGTTRLGQVTDNQANYRNFSAKVVSNMTWQARSYLNLKTTLGSDYVNQEADSVSASGQQLPPGGQTVGESAVQSASNALQTVNKTWGLYAQEEAAIRDRLWLTAALRTDQNSSFGTNFQRVVYPKASLSWLVSDESFFPKYDWLNNFRLRAAYGASGVQPGGTVSLQTYRSQTSNLITNSPGATGGTDTPGLLQNALGNPNLKPERSTEFETGFETSVLANRLHIDATYYSKHTNDGLISLPIASSSGAAATSVLANEASTQNTGYELTVNSTIIDHRQFGWDITVAGSHNSNKILSLGNDLAGNPVPTIVNGSTRDAVGFPINAWFVHPYTYADTSSAYGHPHDGIITPDEVTVTPTYEYAGYSSPRDLFSVTNGIDFLNHKLRFTASTDYKGGYVLYNQTGQFYAQNFSSWYSNSLKSTPLWDQARTVANSAAKNPTPSTHGYLENGQFWKLREVSAILTLPDAATARIRAHDAQLVFSARNLHTWTSYTGPDPEENYGTGDVQTDFSTLAPPRYFIVRLNLHY